MSPRHGWMMGLGGVAAIVMPTALLVVMTSMPGPSERPEVLEADPRLVKALEAHVRVLASDIGPRSLYRGTLERSARYIQDQVASMQLSVEPLPYLVSGTPVSNLQVSLTGQTSPEKVVLLGAHYDTVDETPGADDNASGVACLLELLRLLAQTPHARSIRVVFFVNEEPPYFQTEQMGSLVYADAAKARGDHITAMLSLESIGVFSDEANSQVYPPGLAWFYPSKGDFVAIVGELGSRSLVRQVVRDFRATGSLPSEGLAAPFLFPGVGWSDHWSFAVNGYPSAMVTDTAPFRNRHYHERTDTPESLDYRRMALVVQGLNEVAAKLARP